MPVPKKKTSQSKRDMRRGHDSLEPPTNVRPCPQCGEPKLPHRVCANCGTYRGREVIQTEEE